MIVSHNYRAIFVHCRKTAGSSIKLNIAPHIGDNDIVVGSWNEILDAGYPLNSAAREVLRKKKAWLAYSAARACGVPESRAINIAIKYWYRNRISPTPAHPTAVEIKKRFPDEWERYFKFAVTRNPFDQVASEYLWKRRMGRRIRSFKVYLESIERKMARRSRESRGAVINWEMMTIDDRIAMDCIVRFEDLSGGMEEVRKRTGIPFEGFSAAAKVNPENGTYGKLYGEEEKELVHRIFRDELETFGYTCPY